MFSLGNFLTSARRIFTVSKKPDLQEYRIMVQVTGIGIIIIGVVAYILKLTASYLPFIG
ncbi:MAG: protein translocase SEC61 complex subunit gamma [Candidatus Diapherotrites archaeon CG10_big_fil_rev_8_21_14_0_10_31_34]|nr:MAG: protein translocase SEC61 complex subunit gamma [Candidatus Diapherotrites archaeon CG10_big_fil_rev_8_21_14_0_10_31_34]